jgi:thymidylate kinase
MAEVFDSRSTRLTLGSTQATPNGVAGFVPATRTDDLDEGASSDAVIAQESSVALPEQAAIPLVARLCEGLRAEGVAYCQFKSNWRLSRWLQGEGDLDLLVERADAGRFARVLQELGFKQARPTRDRQLPGVSDYYGFDEEARKFVHLHVHYQLILGHDLTKNFRLPLERPYLASVSRDGLIPTPLAEFELILFVLRMVLKDSLADRALNRLAGAKKRNAGAATREELAFLEARARRERVERLVREHLPFVGVEFFDECVHTLKRDVSAWRRASVRRELEQRLGTHARRERMRDASLKVGRRVKRLLVERGFGRTARKQLVTGGALVALVGGDGAGKTTAVEGLHAWLSKKFDARRFHLGKPPRSLLTLAVIVALHLRRMLPGGRPRAGEFPGYLRLLRWVLASRDRRRLYERARRYATNGGVAVCDRFPVERLRLMDGPNIARTVEPARVKGLVRRLLEAEERNYRQIMEPDVLFVLRVEPEVAVRRKTIESEEHVRTRSRELWEQDWTGTRAHVVDAGRTADEVLAHLQSVVWRNL